MNHHHNDDSVLVAAVEGGGTTFVLSIARLYTLNNNKTPPNVEQQQQQQQQQVSLWDEGLEIIETTSIPSSDPDVVLEQCCEWLSARRPLQAVGIACFGPIGVKRQNTQEYGRILNSSPKKEWRNVDIVTPIVKACSTDSTRTIPHFLDTDVNAPAMAEFETKKKAVSSLAYITVGTGVGVGLVVNSKPVHGQMHPEGGHVCVQPLKTDTFEGYSWGKQCSPYGGVHTVEGISSSVALTERIIARESTTTTTTTSRDDLALLEDTDEVWDHAANAIANLCVSLILLLSMEEIVIGGGIMKRTILYTKIRTRVTELINGYVSLPSNLEGFIREPTWGDSAGLVGALMLAKKAYHYENDNEERQRESTTTVVQTTEAKERDNRNGVVAKTVLATSLAAAVLFSLGKILSLRRR